MQNITGRNVTFFIIPVNRHGEKGKYKIRCWGKNVRHTCFPFGERYMTSRFILNKFDLDLSSSGLLVRFGLLIVVVVVSCTVDSFMIVDERVFDNRGRAG